MNTKSSIVIFCYVNMLCLAADIYYVDGVLIPAYAVAINEQIDMTPSVDLAKPAMKVNRYIFDTSWGPFEVGYSRYLNSSVQWQGKYGASINSDMGLGIPGYDWNWYRGNTLRVKVDGNDIIALKDADTVDWQDGDSIIARWRGVWKTDHGNMLIYIVVIDGLDTALVEVEFDGIAETIELLLTCYPGGMGPAYGHASLRSVEAGGQTVEVGTGQYGEQMQILAGVSEIFYSDRWSETHGMGSSGACGLYFLSDTISSGTIDVGSYVVTTHLCLHKDSKVARFALTGYEVPNSLARKCFFDSRSEIKRLLKTTQFYKEVKR